MPEGDNSRGILEDYPQRRSGGADKGVRFFTLGELLTRPRYLRIAFTRNETHAVLNGGASRSASTPESPGRASVNAAGAPLLRLLSSTELRCSQKVDSVKDSTTHPNQTASRHVSWLTLTMFFLSPYINPIRPRLRCPDSPAAQSIISFLQIHHCQHKTSKNK